jgi:hypothetical protein
MVFCLARIDLSRSDTAIAECINEAPHPFQASPFSLAIGDLCLHLRPQFGKLYLLGCPATRVRFARVLCLNSPLTRSAVHGVLDIVTRLPLGNPLLVEVFALLADRIELLRRFLTLNFVLEENIKKAPATRIHRVCLAFGTIERLPTKGHGDSPDV